MTKNMLILIDKAKAQGWSVEPGDNRTVRFESPEGNRLVVWTEMGSYNEIADLVAMLERLDFQP